MVFCPVAAFGDASGSIRFARWRSARCQVPIRPHICRFAKPRHIINRRNNAEADNRPRRWWFACAPIRFGWARIICIGSTFSGDFGLSSLTQRSGGWRLRCGLRSKIAGRFARRLGACSHAASFVKAGTACHADPDHRGHLHLCERLFVILVILVILATFCRSPGYILTILVRI